MAAEPDGARDRGFTLLETIVVILLIAVLSSVMVAVVAVIYRNAPSTEARTDESHSYERLMTSLSRDAASTPPSGFVFASGSTVCVGASGAGSLVQLTWTDGQGTTYAADYRFSGAGSPVTRHACSGSGAAPYSGTEARDVSGIVFDAHAMTPVSGAVGVTMNLTTCGDPECAGAGPIIALEAGSRNPDEALP